MDCEHLVFSSLVRFIFIVPVQDNIYLPTCTVGLHHTRNYQIKVIIAITATQYSPMSEPHLTAIYLKQKPSVVTERPG